MKLCRRIRQCIFILFVGVFLCGVFSCDFMSSVASAVLGGQSEAEWNGQTSSLEYDGRQVQYEVPQNVRTLNLTANEPVDIFMVKMNVGTGTIPARSTRYIVSATTGSNAGASYSSRSALEEEPLLTIADWENVSGISASGIIRKDFAPARDFVPPVLGLGGSSRSAAGASYSVVGEPVKSVTQITPTVDSTKKELWVDAKGDGNYSQESATLRAVGTNCYIWVLDENFTTGEASGSKINATKAQAIAEKFDSMYSLIRGVFGEESDKMIHVQGGAEVITDIANVSDTGTMVNIVVYDIVGDYEDGQESGIVGYFWAKDYYTKENAATSNDSTIKLTNAGKYFYVDSGFLNNFENVLYSTLAHEFQHMINFGQKTMKSMETAEKKEDVLASQAWSNEMMSMVCEDMLQGYLGLSDEDSPIARLSMFNEYYYFSGLTDWLSGDYVAVSYAGAYAFGAYLARNYGGTALIKEIATNNYVDQEAITKALESIGKSETFESVFEKYAQALVLDNPPSSANAPSFKKSVSGIGGNMKAIDIFNVQYQDELGRTQTSQPYLMKTDANSRVELRPYGFTLHSVEYTESAGTVQLTFSSPVSTNEKVYILVQPHK